MLCGIKNSASSIVTKVRQRLLRNQRHKPQQNITQEPQSGAVWVCSATDISLLARKALKATVSHTNKKYNKHRDLHKTATLYKIKIVLITSKTPIYDYLIP